MALDGRLKNHTSEREKHNMARPGFIASNQAGLYVILAERITGLPDANSARGFHGPVFEIYREAVSSR